MSEFFLMSESYLGPTDCDACFQVFLHPACFHVTDVERGGLKTNSFIDRELDCVAGGIIRAKAKMWRGSGEAVRIRFEISRLRASSITSYAG